MKKFVVTLFICMAALSPISAWADSTGFQLGVGGTWAIENLDPSDPYDLGISYDDGWGVNVRAGGEVHKNLTILADLDIIQGFDWKDVFSVWGTPVSASSEVSAAAITAGLKLKAPVAETLELYLTPGFGYMACNEDVSVTVPGYTAAKGFDANGACAKLAAGADIHFNEHVGLYLEGAHTWGFGDVDRVRYACLTAGLLFTF